MFKIISLYDSITPKIVQICIQFICTIIFILIIKKLIKKFRSKDVLVNCWFCSLNTHVPRGNKNCWSCPNCDQYNGFKEDGDYNKVIPSQYYEHMNHGIGATKISNANISDSKYFCDICLEKQTRQINALNQFIPTNEHNYAAEYAKFKAILEEQFALCFVCKTRVQDQLNSINNWILPDYIKWSARYNRQQSIKNRKSYSFINQLNIVPSSLIIGCLLLQLVAFSSQYRLWQTVFTEFIIKHQQLTNALSFLIVCSISRFARLRPSLRFSNAQLTVHFLVIAYDFALSQVDIVKSHKHEKLLRLASLVFSVYALLTFLRNFLRLTVTVDQRKFSLSSVLSPTKKQPDNHPKQITSMTVQKSSSNGTTVSTACSYGPKPSRLNYVKTPNSLFEAKLHKVPNGVNNRSNYAGSSVWNFESVSQCPSTTLRPLSRQSGMDTDNRFRVSAGSPCGSTISHRTVFSDHNRSSVWNFDSVSQCPSISGSPLSNRSAQSSGSFRTVRSHIASVTRAPAVDAVVGPKSLCANMLRILVGAALGSLLLLVSLLVISYVDASFVNWFY